MKNIILLTDPDGKHLAYGSIVALLEDPDNPLRMTEQNFQLLLKKSGWPVNYSSCVIEKIKMLTASEARQKKTKSRFL